MWMWLAGHYPANRVSPLPPSTPSGGALTPPAPCSGHSLHGTTSSDQGSVPLGPDASTTRDHLTAIPLVNSSFSF